MEAKRSEGHGVDPFEAYSPRFVDHCQSVLVDLELLVSRCEGVRLLVDPFQGRVSESLNGE
jgi:hypothetical protein